MTTLLRDPRIHPQPGDIIYGINIGSGPDCQYHVKSVNQDPADGSWSVTMSYTEKEKDQPPISLERWRYWTCHKDFRRSGETVTSHTPSPLMIDGFLYVKACDHCTINEVLGVLEQNHYRYSVLYQWLEIVKGLRDQMTKAREFFAFINKNL
jgi:hypothetical protein